MKNLRLITSVVLLGFLTACGQSSQNADTLFQSDTDKTGTTDGSDNGSAGNNNGNGQQGGTTLPPLTEEEKYTCDELKVEFAVRIFPVLENSECSQCHASGDIELYINVADGREESFDAAMDYINVSGQDALFYSKPAGVAHLGGDFFTEGSDSYNSFKFFADNGQGLDGCRVAQPVVPDVARSITDFSQQQVEAYLRMLAPRVAGRQLSLTELDQIQNDGVAVYETIIDSWLSGEGVVDTARRHVSVILNSSGKKDDVNFDLPGNLAAYIVDNDLPWSTLLTADYCVDDAGEKTECDTGAPYTAGIFTTKGYLANNMSRFNLRRASTLLEQFACSAYPVSQSLEPSIEKSRLIPMFQLEDLPEGEEGGGDFGNGEACYSCHSQFAWHSQLFVKFTVDGTYINDATGIQDPDGELGRATDNLLASHFLDEDESASEVSQMFGTAVTNLADASQAIVVNEAYQACTLRHMVMMSFGVSSFSAKQIDNDKIDGLLSDIHSINSDPKLQDYLAVILKDIDFVENFISQTDIK